MTAQFLVSEHVLSSFQCQPSICPIRDLYEPYAKEVDDASENLALQEEIMQAAFDEIAPQCEHEDAINAQLLSQRNTSTSCEDSDIGIEMGLPPLRDPVQITPSQEMPDDVYRDLHQQLNQQQYMFFHSILHHVKTSNEPIYRFLSGEYLHIHIYMHYDTFYPNSVLLCAERLNISPHELCNNFTKNLNSHQTT